ncbi:MAG: hypothetical protein HN348_24685 [Proteobacteria bacterium]|nr:hypothetical protein [Pseudomonadota bacterium]
MNRTLAIAVPTAFLLASSACTWIGPKYKATAIDTLDEDGDGCSKSEDCDDENPNECGNFTEIPYDGWDNDCDNGEVVDVDGDGYPGITKAQWEENNSATDEVWPLGVSEDEVDCRDVRPEDLEAFAFVPIDPSDTGLIDTDVLNDTDANYEPVTHDNAADINPGTTTDAPYDGIDQDCSANNDFDVDGDGYLFAQGTILTETNTAIEDAFAAYQAEWGYTFSAPEFIGYGDCDDDASDVNPAVLPETDIWYDGTDQDCALNNDFDQDLDGYLPDGYETEYNTFVAKYYGKAGPPWTVHDGVDCLDIDDPNWPDVAAADINPGASETFYDGVDQDCLGDNDFDQDGDGFRLDGDGNLYETYEIDWIYTNIPTTSTGDCDDEDSTVTPAALEHFGDLVDQDCDGHNDTTPFGFGDMMWDAPRNVVIGGNDGRYMLTTSADLLLQGTSSLDKIGITFFFETADAGHQAHHSGQTIWQGASTPSPLGHEVAMLASGDTFYAATSYFASTGPANTLIVKKMDFNTINKTYSQALAFRGFNVADEAYNGLDLQADSNADYWAFACGDSIAHFVTASSSSGTFSRTSSGYDTIVGGSDCFLDVTDTSDSIALATVCDQSNGCISYDVNAEEESVTVSAEQPWEDEEFATTLTRGDLLLAPYLDQGLLIHDHLNDVDYELLSDEKVIYADYAAYGPDSYVAAIIEDADDSELHVLLLWGTLGDTLDEVEFPVYRGFDTLGSPITDLDPETCSVFVDKDRIMLAITGSETAQTPEEDGVGWVFLSH